MNAPTILLAICGLATSLGGPELVPAAPGDPAPEQPPAADEAHEPPAPTTAPPVASSQPSGESKEPARRGSATLQVRTTPPGAAVFEGDELLGVTPLSIDVTAGEHKIELHKPGFVQQRKTLSVVPSVTMIVDTRLDELPPPPRRVRDWNYLIIGGGVTLAAGVFATATGAVLMSDEASYRNGTIALGTGVALLAVGALMEGLGISRLRRSRARLDKGELAVRF